MIAEERTYRALEDQERWRSAAVKVSKDGFEGFSQTGGRKMFGVFDVCTQCFKMHETQAIKACQAARGCTLHTQGHYIFFICSCGQYSGSTDDAAKHERKTRSEDGTSRCVQLYVMDLAGYALWRSALGLRAVFPTAKKTPHAERTVLQHKRIFSDTLHAVFLNQGPLMQQLDEAFHGKHNVTPRSKLLNPKPTVSQAAGDAFKILSGVLPPPNTAAGSLYNPATSDVSDDEPPQTTPSPPAQDLAGPSSRVKKVNVRARAPGTSVSKVRTQKRKLPELVVSLDDVVRTQSDSFSSGAAAASTPIIAPNTDATAASTSNSSNSDTNSTLEHTSTRESVDNVDTDARVGDVSRVTTSSIDISGLHDFLNEHRLDVSEENVDIIRDLGLNFTTSPIEDAEAGVRFYSSRNIMYSQQWLPGVDGLRSFPVFSYLFAQGAVSNLSRSIYDRKLAVRNQLVLVREEMRRLRVNNTKLYDFSTGLICDGVDLQGVPAPPPTTERLGPLPECDSTWWQRYPHAATVGTDRHCERTFPVFDMHLYTHLRTGLRAELPDLAINYILRELRGMLFFENIDSISAGLLIDSLSALIGDTCFSPPFS